GTTGHFYGRRRYLEPAMCPASPESHTSTCRVQAPRVQGPGSLHGQPSLGSWAHCSSAQRMDRSSRRMAAVKAAPAQTGAGGEAPSAFQPGLWPQTRGSFMARGALPCLRGMASVSLPGHQAGPSPSRWDKPGPMDSPQSHSSWGQMRAQRWVR
ncbi:hypothetical protein H1C71_003645, partial [Ictidomys tridecemlineatus]